MTEHAPRVPGTAATVSDGDADLRFSSYGLHFSLRTTDVQVLSRLMTCLPPRWRRSSAPVVGRSYRVTHGTDVNGLGVRCNELLVEGHSLACGCDFEQLCDCFEADLQLYVAEMARRRVFVHAGAVGWAEQAIVIPGRSRSGKTTLVAELVRAGATYYSDEFAVLDDRGRVHPYPRPLSIRQEQGRPRKQPVEALGGRRGARPLRVGLVILTEYRSAAAFEPRLLSPGAAALALLAHTVSARRQPGAAMTALKHVVVRAAVLQGERGDARTAIDAIIRLLESSSEARRPDE